MTGNKMINDKENSHIFISVKSIAYYFEKLGNIER